MFLHFINVICRYGRETFQQGIARNQSIAADHKVFIVGLLVGYIWWREGGWNDKVGDENYLFRISIGSPVHQDWVKYLEAYKQKISIASCKK